jgi:formylglycine-generating enzyme required for sulfatase activity
VDVRQVLPTGTLLDGSYRIRRVVGSGGFGITYEADDIHLATVVAIKEYYPFDFGERTASMTVRPKSDRHKHTFDWGRSNFIKEARTLARFEHPNIVHVTRVFEANSTAYMVMRFERGKNLEQWLKGLGRLPTQDELDRIAAPLLDALEVLHASNFLHRDLAPDNIMVRADGTPVLLDFGAARRAVAQMSQALTEIVKAGYSPHEQYSSDPRLQGPWTDIYALGGTLYRAIAGKAPEEATLRFDEDRMPSAGDVGRGHFRPGFLAAIDSCLKIRHSQRPQSVAELRPKLLEAEKRRTRSRFVEALRRRRRSRTASPLQARRMAFTIVTRRWSIIFASIVAIVGGAYGGFLYTRWPPERADIDSEKRRNDAKEAEAKGRIALDEKKRKEAEAKRQADLDAEKERKADAKRRADLEAEKQKQEQLKRQAALQAEEERKQAEAKRQAELEAEKRHNEAEVKRQAALEAEKRRNETEAKRQAELQAERVHLTEKYFRDCANCPELVPIPPGEFWMGSSKADVDSGIAADNESPQRKVIIKQRLAVGRFEVTRDQFEAFVRASGHKVADKCWTLEGNEPKERDKRSFRDPGFAQLGTHPVVCVSWEDAKAYVAWLSSTIGKLYRLLSEAQWEYVARAGTTGRYSFADGEADLCGYGNGADQTARSAGLPSAWDYIHCNDGYVHTAPVGSFKANAFGIFDLMGNAWEWVEDCYADNLAAIPTDGQAWSSSQCQVHAVRGGSWSATARMLRVTVRGKAPASSRYDDVGFRVVRTLAIEP